MKPEDKYLALIQLQRRIDGIEMTIEELEMEERLWENRVRLLTGLMEERNDEMQAMGDIFFQIHMEEEVD